MNMSVTTKPLLRSRRKMKGLSMLFAKQSRWLTNVILMAGLGMSLAACAGNQKFATLSDGACSAFPRPQYQIRGVTRYDQKWADETTEAGVAGCNWHRPQLRPARLVTKAVPIETPADLKPTTFKHRWLGHFFRKRAAK